jgi:hypothetical protein|tara:strand:+ start:174 stop:368 length:195 start_codon:yes stop_codon:yes gene_type:complete
MTVFPGQDIAPMSQIEMYEPPGMHVLDPSLELRKKLDGQRPAQRTRQKHPRTILKYNREFVDSA